MAGYLAYLDSSAFLKLVVEDPESAALAAALRRWPQRVSASLLSVETVRALLRIGGGQHVSQARRLLRRVRQISVDERLLARAAELEPLSLRTLDSIHLAAALELGPDLGCLFSYDLRLSDAARGYGIDVIAPG